MTLNRIKTTATKKLLLVNVPKTPLVRQLLVRLKRIGLISSFQTTQLGVFNVHLRNFDAHLLKHQKLISTPGKPRYIKKREIYNRYYGYPLAIFSTKSGLVDIKQLFAHETRHGGEILVVFGPRPNVRKI